MRHHAGTKSGDLCDTTVPDANRTMSFCDETHAIVAPSGATASPLTGFFVFIMLVTA